MIYLLAVTLFPSILPVPNFFAILIGYLVFSFCMIRIENNWKYFGVDYEY